MKNPLLITGIHRSGSTWIGKTFALAPELCYIHEPFNIKKHPEAPFDVWFLYLNESFPQKHSLDVKAYLNGFRTFSVAQAISGVLKAKYPGQARDVIVEQINRQLKRPLFKDPIAVLSAEWMHKELNSEVVLSVRHPAAFVASIKVKDWQFDFRNFLRQEELMDTKFSLFRSEIMDLAASKRDIIDQGILLWNCIHAVINDYRIAYAHNNDWSFVRHEDLSLKPLETFRDLFKKHGLTFNEQVSRAILASTQSDEKKYLTRNAKKNITTWKDRLTQAEIERIKKGTENIWPLFYEEDSWL